MSISFGRLAGLALSLEIATGCAASPVFSKNVQPPNAISTIAEIKPEPLKSTSICIAENTVEMDAIKVPICGPVVAQCMSMIGDKVKERANAQKGHWPAIFNAMAICFATGADGKPYDRTCGQLDVMRTEENDQIDRLNKEPEVRRFDSCMQVLEDCTGKPIVKGCKKTDQ